MRRYTVIAFLSLLLMTGWLIDTWRIDIDESTEVTTHLHSGSVTIFNTSSVTITIQSPLPFQVAVKPGRTIIKSSPISRTAGDGTYRAQYILSERSTQGLELHIKVGADLSITLVSTDPLQVETQRWNASDREMRQTLALTMMVVILYYFSWLDRHEWVYRLRDKIVYKP